MVPGNPTVADTNTLYAASNGAIPAGSDLLVGGDGSDTILGWGGDDYIAGGVGGTSSGYAFGDTIKSGGGNNLIQGGVFNNLFVGFGYDTVTSSIFDTFTTVGPNPVTLVQLAGITKTRSAVFGANSPAGQIALSVTASW